MRRPRQVEHRHRSLPANSHLRNRREQATVGPIVIRQAGARPAGAIARRWHVEKFLSSLRRLSQIRRHRCRGCHTPARGTDPPSRLRPPPEIDQDEPKSRPSDQCATAASACLPTSRTGAKPSNDQRQRRGHLAGHPTALSRQLVFIDNESLPTGIAMPSAGQNSSPTAFTVSIQIAHLRPAHRTAAIQFADSLYLGNRCRPLRCW